MIKKCIDELEVEFEPNKHMRHMYLSSAVIGSLETRVQH